jgi:osmoprotectant transport system permease protein
VLGRCTHFLASVIASLLAIAGTPAAAHSDPIQVGSKKFTESVILGEIVATLLDASGIEAVHRSELGGSRILFSALESGEIDIYPEYTGTLARELLANEIDDSETPSLSRLSEILAAHGITLIGTLGFDNRYAMGIKRSRARALSLTRISDLASPDAAETLRVGVTNEFLHRRDGWPGLRSAYGLENLQIRGLDHDLAYKALVDDAVDVIDVYSTDAEIHAYDLVALEDDRGWFPSYEAILLVRTAVLEQFPSLTAALEPIMGNIDADRMRALNAAVKVERLELRHVAAAFLAERGINVVAQVETRVQRLLRTTLEHLALTLVSLVAAITVGLPLGIAAMRNRSLGKWILAAIGMLQTVPALALLVTLIPLVGIGAAPAVLALFAYSLLPIVRGMYSGLQSIPQSIVDSARALGLTPAERLRIVELPMAVPSILAGIKTAAVINVGTATLGALVGAGGYGQPILAGIRLDDTSLILEGAIPAALLALAVQSGFDLVESVLSPPGLRSLDETRDYVG